MVHPMGPPGTRTFGAPDGLIVYVSPAGGSHWAWWGANIPHSSEPGLLFSIMRPRPLSSAEAK
jgi:hypothetical protein